MKLIKTRIRNSITDQNLGRLMRIAIEGPELSAVNFNEVLFKQKNRRIYEGIDGTPLRHQVL